MYETTSTELTADQASNVGAVASLATSLVVALIATALLVVMIVALWKMFTKAGEAGWKSLVPIYNSYILLKISGMSGWWLLAMFVPFLNVIVVLLQSLNLAKAFNRSAVFGVFGLFLFNVVGYLILGFGKDQYVGPNAAAPAPAPATPAV